MKQIIQITQHYSFNVCNSITYGKMHFLRTINPISYPIYTFGALCQNMEFDRPKICHFFFLNISLCRSRIVLFENNTTFLILNMIYLKK